ncbi:MAG: DEAD/DEAH box helicase [Actinomycetes bacterium]
MSAMAAIDCDENVLVAAPTGSGKTVVAEHAVARALAAGGRAIYTAPIKALSNQKFADLRSALGPERVGLLTGDHSVQPDAPVLVVTTEVLRNMVYAGSDTLADLMWVVLDEVHFLQDPYRGPVWEEVLIHSPRHVRFVCLSATVSNADELGEWVTALRGPTATIVEHRRPVDLDALYLVGDRQSERDHLVPLIVDGACNPQGARYDATPDRQRHARGRQRPRFHTPRRVDVVERLHEEHLLPSIYFIFSRNGCGEAAKQAVDAGVRLTTSEERQRIRTIVERHTAALDDGDLDVLGYSDFVTALECGVAPHHAGMVPAFRETVEECFVEGLVRLVFATETLALGINMPARSVVIERLSKYTGDGHELLTAGQFTQLTGRAGRRGIDDHGAAVVLWSPFTTFDQVATLAASREYPLVSAFRPTYNMVANLVGHYDRTHAERLIGQSFAQFQADRAVVGLRRRAEELRHALADEQPPHDVSVDDIEAYDALVAATRRAHAGRAGGRRDVESALRSLRPGDVVVRDSPQGPRALLIIAVSQRRGGDTRLRAVTARGSVVQVDAASAGGPLRAVARVDLPTPFNPSDARFRKESASRLRRVKLPRTAQHQRTGERDAAHDAARRALESHPMHRLPHRDDAVEWLATHRRRTAELERIERRIERRGSDLSDRLTRILQVLEGTTHSSGWSLTESGKRLRRIYHESDLLLSMAIDEGLFDELDPAECAALVSCVTYEHRSKEPPPPPALPTRRAADRFRSLGDIAERLQRLERNANLPLSRSPEAGFAVTAYEWASGRSLRSVVDDDQTGGDFVRNCRLLVDLLPQLAALDVSAATSLALREAAYAVRRGVVDAGGGPA